MENMAFSGHIYAPNCAILSPSLAPLADLVQFLWFKMAGIGVLHIVLHVLGSTRTFGGYFRPKKSVLSKIATFGSEKSWECLTECGRKVPSTGPTSKTFWGKT